MPELPEVEVTRRSFADAIALGRIESVTLGKPLRWPLGCDAQSLVGRQVLAVHRRGKYLLLQLDQGWLLVHLGMSGSLSFATALPPAGVHDHCTLVTDRGVLRLNDPRRFGAVVFVASLDDAVARKLLGGLGAEPLASDFDPVALVPLLRSRSAPIKQVLLAGDVVVGAGNIYACEALFLARVRPTRAARRLTRAEALRLLLAVQQVLARAVEAGGTTLRDFADAQGQSGHYQGEVMVYGRAGLPCHTCGTPIQLIRRGSGPVSSARAASRAERVGR